MKQLAPMVLAELFMNVVCFCKFDKYHNKIWNETVIQRSQSVSGSPRCLLECNASPYTCTATNLVYSQEKGFICELMNIREGEFHADRLSEFKGGMFAILKDLTSLNNTSNDSLAPNSTTAPPQDCHDVMLSGQTTSGVALIYPYPNDTARSLDVYCDMGTDGGGWTVLMRRQDGSEDFNRLWADYKNGFGNISGEFWAGNDVMHMMTSYAGRPYRLRIDMTSFGSVSRHALYSQFVVKAESDNYALQIGGYSGNANDAFGTHNKDAFTTPDRDHDTVASYNCGQRYHSGWWYHDCSEARLTGLYGQNVRDDMALDGTIYHQGILWKSWLGLLQHPEFVEMKIKAI